jgi:hypothetical protein
MQKEEKQKIVKKDATWDPNWYENFEFMGYSATELIRIINFAKARGYGDDRNRR